MPQSTILSHCATRIVFTFCAIAISALVNQAAIAQAPLPVTFTRNGTSAASILFSFGSLTGNDVVFDEIGPEVALSQLNDNVGETILVGSPISSIGIVEMLQELTFGQDFGSDDSLDLIDGEPVFIGFNASNNVGYFELTFEPNSANADEFDIIYSNGFFASEGQSLTVGATAVPEPSSFTYLALVSIAGLARRRR